MESQRAHNVMPNLVGLFGIYCREPMQAFVAIICSSVLKLSYGAYISETCDSVPYQGFQA